MRRESGWSLPPSSSREFQALPCSSGRGRAAALRRRIGCAGSRHDGRWHEGYDPYSFPLEIDDGDLARFAAGSHIHAHRFLGAHARTVSRRARHALRRLGAERRARQRRRHVQPLGRPLSSDERARQLRRLGAVHARATERRALQVRDLGPRQPRAQAEDGPLWRRIRDEARHGERYDPALDVPMGRCAVARATRGSATGSRSRSRSTKCTWARGGAARPGIS